MHRERDVDMGGDRSGVEQLEMIIQKIKQMDEGAFAPFSQQPVLRAILIPFGSYGGVMLLESLRYLNL